MRATTEERSAVDCRRHQRGRDSVEFLRLERWLRAFEVFYDSVGAAADATQDVSPRDWRADVGRGPLPSNEVPGHLERMFRHAERYAAWGYSSAKGKCRPGRAGYVWLLKYIRKRRPTVAWVERRERDAVVLMFDALVESGLVEVAPGLKRKWLPVYQLTPEGHIVCKMGLTGLEQFIQEKRHERHRHT